MFFYYKILGGVDRDMELMYRSTRGNCDLITASEAIIKGIAEDGGLYVPVAIPKIHEPLEDIMNFSYKQLAFYILQKFLTDFEDEELIQCIDKAYDEKFDDEQIVPLRKEENAFFLELYHGPTLAFKDMALSILPHLLKAALKKHNISKEVVILTATSGDTGKAALEGFANVEGTRIVVFFPENGVSDIQKRQMTTQEGNNTYVAAIDGNFDDAQSGVKKIFNDKSYKEFLEGNNYILSSANSINIGRLLPQIVYYFYAYLNMMKNKNIEKNEKVNIVVPTGNFGNIMAAYYAQEMGLPVNNLICASNENNVLYDFIKTGVYDRRRELKLTSSPSMDILISSNLERFIYYLSGEDCKVVAELMKKLNIEGKYEIAPKMKTNLCGIYGGFATESETLESIRKVYDKFNYVIDTHTAVAYSVYEKYKNDIKDDSKTIIASTASPFKFTRSVCRSIGIDTDKFNDFQLIDELSKNTGLKIPKGIKGLEHRKVVHKSVCNKENMKAAVDKFLNM